MKRLFCCLLLAGACLPVRAFDFQTETPVRFEFTYFSTVGDTNASCSTPWKTTYVPPGAIKLYYTEGNVPYAFSAGARLVLACDATNVWAGNTFPCRAWLMPASTDDAPNRITSNYGFEFGLLYRPWFTDKSGGFVKDFRSAFDNEGLFPLGNDFLGGLDTINFLSLPIDELAEGAAPAIQVLQGLLNVAGESTLNICSVDIATEGVVEGTSVRVNIGGTDLTFTNMGPSGATNFLLNIPMAAVQTGEPFYTISCQPRLIYNFYQGIGVQWCLVDPLSITMTPSLLDRASALTGLGHYEPPPASSLHSDSYSRSRTGDAVPAVNEISLALPLNRTPPKPDLITSDLRSVDDAGRGMNTVDLYANETSLLRFSICNGGATSTVLTSDFVWDVTIDSVDVFSNRVLCHMGTPAFTLRPGESTNITFAYTFTEGPHTIAYSSGYIEFVGYEGGAERFAIGDCNPYNNMKARAVLVKPARGTVAGCVRANPDSYDTEMWTTNVLVRLTGPGLSRTLRSGSEPFPLSGRFEFTGVPTGDYMLEILPSPGNSPAFVPRSVTFHHDASVITDLSSESFAILRQMQRLRTSTRTASMQPITNAVVTIRPLDLRRAVSSTNGLFELSGIGPVSFNALRIEHPLYRPRSIGVSFNVSDSCTSLQYLSRYLDLATTQWVDSAYIELTPDTTPPVLEMDTLPAPAVYSNSLTCRFYADDRSEERAADTFRYRIRTSGSGSDLVTGSWLSYTNAAGTNAQVALTIPLSGLGEGAFDLYLDVRDPAGNKTISAAQTFTHDSRAPGFTVAIAGGASVITSRTASVTITVTNSEAGPLTAEFSNDGVTWSASYAFSSSVFTLPNWQLATCNTTNLARTVQVRVHDLAGFTGTGSDSILVNNFGTIVLAGGAPYSTSRTVPVDIQITPPRGSVIYSEPQYKEALLELATGERDRSEAQEFSPPITQNINAIELWPSYPAHSSGDLQVYIVEKLTDGDPHCTGFVLTNALVTRAEITAAAGGAVTVRIPVAVQIRAGRTYYLLLLPESPMYFQAGTTGNTSNGGHGLYRWICQDTWSRGPDEEAPDHTSYTIAFNLLYETRGQMRIATDGACDTETWQPYVYPVPSNLSVTFTNDGWKVAILQYSNAALPAMNGYYQDSILVDTLPPVCTRVTLPCITTNQPKFIIDVQAADAGSGVSTASWSTDWGSTWSSAPYGCTLSSPYGTHEIRELWVRLTDRAGNVSAITSAPFPDIFPPDFSCAAIPPATNTPSATFFFKATDTSGVALIGLRELRTGEDYGNFPGDTEILTVKLPKIAVKKGDEPDFVEGTYLFAAWAADTKCNVSTQQEVQAVYDCTPPVLHGVKLRDGGGGPVANSTNLLLDVFATDNIGPMHARCRFPGRAWSGWSDLASGTGTFPLGAPFVAANAYTVQVEVCDAPGNTVSGQAVIAVNHPPATPGFVYPVGNAAGPATDFRATPFSDPDGHACGATIYEVRRRDRMEWYRSSGGLAGEARFRIATSGMVLDGPYEWRVAQMDAYGLWSAYSAWQAFTPRLDSDNDGLCDLTEDLLGTDRHNPDTDGDGLSDAIEDDNRNGIVDPGETDPRLADTDGDGVNDGAEVAAGTNPLDAASYFHISSLSISGIQAFGHFRARGGCTYDVLRYDQVPNGRDPPATAATIRVTGGVAPWYEVDAVFTNKITGISNRFYRVQVRP